MANLLILKYLISKSFKLKDLAGIPPKSLILIYRGRGVPTSTN